jgi:hypothetical protein
VGGVAASMACGPLAGGHPVGGAAESSFPGAAPHPAAGARADRFALFGLRCIGDLAALALRGRGPLRRWAASCTTLPAAWMADRCDPDGR